MAQRSLQFVSVDVDVNVRGDGEVTDLRLKVVVPKVAWVVLEATALYPLHSQGEPKMNVEEIMSRSPRTCRVSDKLNRPAQLMWENACGCIPVLDNANQVVGMVTDRDVCMAAYTQGKRLEDIDVSSAMSHAVHSCLPSDSVEAAAVTMQKGLVRRLPVLTLSGELVGLVSLHDMAIAANDGSGRRGKENLVRAVESTLTAVCRRHGQQSAAA